MIDKIRRRVPPGSLPTFSPVPRHYQRHDGWTPERQQGFIEALADTGSVKAAAHRVNMTSEGAYHLRRHPEAAEFRKAWETALAMGVQQLEDIAMERALHGQEVPVYSYGKLIGTRVVFNDRLLMFILRNRSAKRFPYGRNPATRAGGKRPDAVQLGRLRAKWRKEWEAEKVRIDERDEQEIYDDLNEKLERHHQDWLNRQSARTREAYENYRRIEAEETGADYVALPPPQRRWERQGSETMGEEEDAGA